MDSAREEMRADRQQVRRCALVTSLAGLLLVGVALADAADGDGQGMLDLYDRSMTSPLKAVFSQSGRWRSSMSRSGSSMR